MDVDVDEGKFDQSHPMQTALSRNLAEKKPSREKVAAVASPQKRKPDPKNHVAVETTKHQPTVKTGTLRRPPGVTVFQHSSLLAKSRERKDHKSGVGPAIASNSGKNKQEDRTNPPASRPKDAGIAKVNSFFSEGCRDPHSLSS